MLTSHPIERNSRPAKRPPSDPPITTACSTAFAWFFIGVPCSIRPLASPAWRHGALKGSCHQEVDGTAWCILNYGLPCTPRQLRLVPKAGVNPQLTHAAMAPADSSADIAAHS